MPSLRAPLEVAIIGGDRPQILSVGFGMRIGTWRLTHHRWCVLSAFEDLNRENANAFVAQYPAACVYHRRPRDDGRRPSRSGQHLPVTAPCMCGDRQRTVRPRTILHEKPRGIHWDVALRMHQVCRDHGVLLAVNHPRPFNRPITCAKALLDCGEFGKLLRLEGAWHNLSEAGTRVLDLIASRYWVARARVDLPLSAGPDAMLTLLAAREL